MKKFISIIAAAACAATLVSFTACGDDEENDGSSSSTAVEESNSSGNVEEETSIPSDIVTAEEWVAAFDSANFANVTVDRSYSYYSDYSTDSCGYAYGLGYYDPTQYEKESVKKTVTSTTKLDLDYNLAEYEYTNRDGSSDIRYFDTYEGYAYSEVSVSYEDAWDKNYTDVEVLKDALGEEYDDYDWSWYNEQCADSNGTDSYNDTYKDYIKHDVDEYSLYFQTYNTYIAEQVTEDGVTGDWEYYNGSYGPDAYAYGSSYPLGGYIDYSTISFWSQYAYYYEGFSYDEESGAYVHTYGEEGGWYDADIMYSIVASGGSYTSDGGYTYSCYIKINDGHISSVKIVYSGKSNLQWTTGSGYDFYENDEVTWVYEYKFYNYGTTTVEVPAEIEAGLAALKESN